MNSSPASSRQPETGAAPRVGTSLHYALNCTPRARRPVLRLWLTWWHETARIPLTVTDPGVAESKLRWWHHALQEAAQGRAQHPTLQALLAEETIGAPGILPDWQLWHEQLEGLITLVHQTRWLDEKSLQQHALATTGAACESAACLLGAHSDAARLAARQVGLGLRQSHQLARLGQDARAGWIHVAIDTLQRFEVRAHQLSKPNPQHVPDGFDALLQHLCNQASHNLRAGLSQVQGLLPGDRRALAPLRALAHIHIAQIMAIRGQGDRVLHERIVLTPLRKWWITQRAGWQSL